MNIIDYIVIAFYLVFMVGMGLIFRKFCKNSSDYFRGGGSILWWMCGSSAFMVAFTAWTFTGAAGKIYETGTLPFVLFFSNVIAYVFVYFFTCYRFRQMRVITYVEGVRKRFGKTSEQFYTWTLNSSSVLFSARSQPA